MVRINLVLPENFLEAEERDGYLVSHEMKEIWAVELDLMNELLRVCRENHIRIFADGGTMLGAVRHGGFIPWDDDIDLVMLREEYQKLEAIASKEFKYPYFWQTERTDPGSMRGHAQLRNCETTGILKKEEIGNFRFNQGIFIDIFPLDYVPDTKEEQKKFFEEIKRYRSKAEYHAYFTSRYSDRGKGIKKYLRRVYHKLAVSGVLKNRAYDQFENMLKKYDKQETSKVGKMFFKTFHDNCVWNAAWFTDDMEMPFEMLQIPVSVNYDEIMTSFFGDWRTPVKVDSTHGNVLFDVNKSYKEYLPWGKQGI